MAIKPALSLRLGQQLRMTPQLQQAIRLLQLSTIDLEMEIQEALDSNPMLEELQPEETSSEDEPTSLDPPEPDAAESTATENTTTETADSTDDDYVAPSDPEVDGEAVPDTRDEVGAETIAVDLPVDSVWEDVFDDGTPATNYQNNDDFDDGFFDERNSEGVSIQSHLMEQINLLRLTESDEIIAMGICPTR